MEDNVLLKYNNNGKDFYLVNENNKLVRYSYFDGKRSKLSKEENDFMSHILRCLIPSCKVVKITDIDYNSNTYEVFFDKKTNLRLINPNNNKVDYEYLNYLFNNQNEYYEYGYGSDDSFIKRIIRVGSKIIIVLLSSALLANTIYGLSEAMDAIEQNSQIEVPIPEEIEEVSEETVRESMISAINSNKNLSEEEKNKIMPCIDAIIDNKEYMDLTFVSNTLKTLKIEYHPEENGSIAGLYYYDNNTIALFNTSSLQETEDFVFYHELSHALSKSISYCTNGIMEQCNAIFNESYFNVSDNCDNLNERSYVRALIQIVGAETLKDFHCNLTDVTLINALKSVINDEDKAIRLLNLIDVYGKLISGTYEKKHPGLHVERLRQTEDDIKNEFSDYFEAKYGYSMDEDLIMLYYLDKDRFNDTIHEYFNIDQPIQVIPQKNVFNTKKNNDYELSIDILKNHIGRVSVDKTYYITEATRHIDYKGIKK